MRFPANLLDRARTKPPFSPLANVESGVDSIWVDGETDSSLQLKLTTPYVCISVILSTTCSARLFFGILIPKCTRFVRAATR